MSTARASGEVMEELPSSRKSSEDYRVIVVGLGAMGSAIVAELALRGVRVLGLERYGPAHALGSSHGASRVIRQAYFEDPAYVPLLLPAYERWRELESATGVELVRETGGLMIGPSGSAVFTGSLASAERWDIYHEVLAGEEVSRRWPVITPDSRDVALFEPHAGFIRPEATIDAQIGLAEVRGADLHFGETVTGWERTRAGVEVGTNVSRYRSSQLVVAAGPWTSQLLRGASIPLTVERHVQFWLRPRCSIGQFMSPHLPVYIWEDASGDTVYGVPATGSHTDCVKAAFFRHGTHTDPDALRRTVGRGEVEPLLSFLAGRIPALGPEVCAAVPCMYTTTPDLHFVVGFLPGETRVVLCSACSGHGFKFAPVFGEVVADLLESGESAFDLSLFDPTRFASVRP